MRKKLPHETVPLWRVAFAEGQPRDGTPLEFLTSVYRNELLPIGLRIDAASKAAPYVHPRLSAVTVGGDKDKPLPVITCIKIVGVTPEPRRDLP